MTQALSLVPVDDVTNDGWTVSGGTETWEVLSVASDAGYIISPSYQGRATVRFPTNNALPEGSVIDSVTVLVRAKTQAGSGPRSITMDLLSSDNTSRYLSRTIYLTSSYTTSEIGTYTRDALGNAWDPHRLDSLLLRLYTVNGLYDSVRVSQVSVQVNYHTKPTVETTGPSGTIVDPTPYITWDYTHAEGEPQGKAEIRIFTEAQVASLSDFSPEAGQQPVFSAITTGSAGAYQLPAQLRLDSYRVYVRAWSEHDARSDWSAKDFAVRPLAPGVPGDNNASTSGTPGVGTPTAVPDTYTSSAQVGMQDTSNLLSAQQADFEVANDALEWTATNATLARSTAEYYGESRASMSLKAVASDDILAETTFVEVGPSRDLTLRVQGLAGSTVRTCELYTDFYDSTFTLIGTSEKATISVDTETWTEAVASTSTPAETAYVKLVYRVVSAAAGEVHYIDRAGLMYGRDTAWSDGGHQSRNMLSSYLATGDDPSVSGETWEAADGTPTLISRVSTSGTGAHGSKAWQMQYGSQSSSIGFRGTGTVFSSTSTGVNYTLNKPTATTNGDLMLAFITSSEQGGIVPPSGWKKVNTATVDDGSSANSDLTLFILKRTAGASEPASWTAGRVTVPSGRRTAVVVSYSGAAPADQQFIAENVRVDGGGALIHRTQVVNNTDSKAWRVAAFAASDNTGSGTFSASATAPTVYPPGSKPGSTPQIQFVNASAPWVEQGRTTSFRLNRPYGVRSGDLMIASATFSGRVTTVTAPSGWTLVHRAHRVFPNSSDGDAHSGDVTVAIFKRTAGSSEPSAWTGTHGQWGQPKVTQVAAYRNCADASEQFIAHGSAGATNASRVTTATVSNNNSRAWRVSIFGATTPFRSSWSGGDVAERSDSSSSLDRFPDAVMKISDSNGPVPTGSHYRTATINSRSNQYSNVPDGNFFTGIGWIGIIKPLPAGTAVSTPGSMAVGTETERTDTRTGTTNPWVNTAVYDSNGPVQAGSTSLYGLFVPGSGSTDNANSIASWIGIIKPSNAAPAGLVKAVTNTWTDISKVNPEVLTLASNKVTVMASFQGGREGTPLLGLRFARGTSSTGSVIQKGAVFGTGAWSKAWATFDLPPGTTRIRPVVAADDRTVGDVVQFDRVSMQFGAPADGEAPAWRNGTSRAEHPIWSRPFIQYVDDIGGGYGEEWTDLRGQKVIPPAFSAATGEMTYVDHTIIPLNKRKYRANIFSYGLQGEVFASGYGPDSNEVSFSSTNWWLKDLGNLANSLRLRVKYEDFEIKVDNTASVYHPLGEDYPVVLTEGFKAGSLSITIRCDRQEEAALLTLLRSGRTLLLQSDTDYVWWVRPVDALGINNMALSQTRRQSNPLKEITVAFVEVKPEE